MSEQATPPVAKRIPTDPRAPRRPGRRRVRLAGRPGRPGHDRLPGGRERLHRGPHGATRRGLRETIFGEIKARTQETDLSVPVRKDGYWYYTRTVEGLQYGIHCRRPVADGEVDPPSTGDGSPLRRRAGPARRQRRGGRLGVLRPRHLRREPGRAPARLLGRPGRRRAVHAAVQGPAHRRGARRRGAQRLLRLGLVGRQRDAVLPHRRRGLAARTGCGGTGSAPRASRTCSCSRNPTSGSGSASA